VLRKHSETRDRRIMERATLVIILRDCGGRSAGNPVFRRADNEIDR